MMTLDKVTYITESGARFSSYAEMKKNCPESVTDNEEPGNLHYWVE